MFRKLILATIASATCLFAVSGAAYATPLLELFQGETITVNDKLFSNWQLITNATLTNGQQGELSQAQLDSIIAFHLDNDPLNPGLRWDAPVGALGTPFGHAGPATVNLDFSFRVSTLSGDPLIKDNSLLATSWVFDAGPLASISITETILSTLGAPPPQLGQKAVLITNNGAPIDPDDLANFAPQSSIDVITRIFISGPGTNDGAFLTGFEQRFSQLASTAVPAPGSAALLMLGLLGLALQRRVRG